MSEEASLSSIPLLHTLETPELEKSSTRPFTSEIARGWRENLKAPDKYNVDVEQYPQGYSRYSALLASQNSFQIWRRFSILRTRLLLLKQDELSQLEEQLENIDAEDEKSCPAFLSNNREDGNEERKKILKKIDSALRDYDSFLERQNQFFNLEPALNRAILNLRNWHDNNNSLAADETKYLLREDLFSHLGNNSWSDRLIDVISQYFATKKEKGKDKSVTILTEPVKQILRVLQAALMAVLLFTPVIICNFVSNLTYRMIIIVATTATFIAVLSLIARTRMKSFDLVIAGTTYATVLVVFISGTNGINN